MQGKFEAFEYENPRTVVPQGVQVPGVLKKKSIAKLTMPTDRYGKCFPSRFGESESKYENETENTNRQVMAMAGCGER
jgi:hypothetical protein